MKETKKGEQSLLFSDSVSTNMITQQKNVLISYFKSLLLCSSPIYSLYTTDKIIFLEHETLSPNV